MDLWLDPIPPVLRARAIEALDEGNADRFLSYAGNHDGMVLVWENLAELRRRGLYEAALVPAFTAVRGNHARWSTAELRAVFSYADRAKLLACGDPLPSERPFTLFRGVAGAGRARRVRGLSWTASPSQAAWFAERGAHFGFADPAVYSVTVDADAVLFRYNGREEDEYVVLLPEATRPKRVASSPASAVERRA